jgi:tricorn protease-like protein
MKLQVALIPLAAWLVLIGAAPAQGPSKSAVRGQSFAYVRWTPLKSEVRVASLEGKDQVLTTFRTGSAKAEHGEDETVSWSPDGKKLVVSGSESRPDLYIVDVRSGGRRRLTHPPANRFDVEPVWSPTGRQVAFVEIGGGARTLWVVNSSGTGKRRISGPGGGQNPSWAPDGSKIAFDGFDGLYIANLRTQPKRISNAALPDPAWSPDGQRVAFITVNTGPHGARYQVYVVGVDGGAKRRVIDGPGSFGARDLTWAPDGVHIAWTDIRQGFRCDVILFDLRRSNWTYVLPFPTESAHCISAAAWSTTGRTLAFVYMKGVQQAIWVKQGRVARNVTKPSGRATWDNPPAWGP